MRGLFSGKGGLRDDYVCQEEGVYKTYFRSFYNVNKKFEFTGGGVGVMSPSSVFAHEIETNFTVLSMRIKLFIVFYESHLPWE